MAKCSFDRVVLNDVFENRFPIGKNLEGRFVYIEDGEKKWLLAAFDFSGTFRRNCTSWRKGISVATGIPAENIWYHELQIHAAPISFELDGEPCRKLIELCIPVVKRMIENAEEAEMSHVLTDMGDKFSMNREQYIPGLGAVTVWAGLQFDEAGRPFTQNTEIMLLDGYKPDIHALQKPVYFDRPVDPQGALLVFRSKAGKILGTISRFAAHPDVAVLFESKGITDQYRYHFDWTGYLRERIDADIGGTGLYMNGPCGNLSVKKGFEGMDTYEACDAEAFRIGSEIASELLRSWHECASSWEDVRLNNVLSESIQLPMRDSIPDSLEESKNREAFIAAAESELRKAIDNNASPAMIKKLIDEKFHQRSISTIINEWAGFSEEELKSRYAGVEVEAVSLNDLVLAGLPGECLTETCSWMKAQSIGNKLLVLDQVNGYMGYMATPEAIDQGGYTYWGSWMERSGERILREAATRLVNKLA